MSKNTLDNIDSILTVTYICVGNILLGMLKYILKIVNICYQFLIYAFFNFVPEPPINDLSRKLNNPE